MERDETSHERNNKNSSKCMCWVRSFSRIYPPLSINAAVPTVPEPLPALSLLVYIRNVYNHNITLLKFFSYVLLS